MRSILNNISIYNHTNAQVLGISLESLFELNEYKKAEILHFPLMSDFGKAAATSYRVLYKIFSAFEMHCVNKRAAFKIDKKGMEENAEICSSPGDLPDFKAIQKKSTTLR